MIYGMSLSILNREKDNAEQNDNDQNTVSNKIFNSIAGNFILINVILGPFEITSRIFSWNRNIWDWYIQKSTQRLPTVFQIPD